MFSSLTRRAGIATGLAALALAAVAVAVAPAAADAKTFTADATNYTSDSDLIDPQTQVTGGNLDGTPKNVAWGSLVNPAFSATGTSAFSGLWGRIQYQIRDNVSGITLGHATVEFSVPVIGYDSATCSVDSNAERWGYDCSIRGVPTGSDPRVEMVFKKGSRSS